jgi:hypothetical protein
VGVSLAELMFADVSEIRLWVIRRVICGVGPSGEPLLGGKVPAFWVGLCAQRQYEEVYLLGCFTCSGRVLIRVKICMQHTRALCSVSNSGKNLHVTRFNCNTHLR